VIHVVLNAHSIVRKEKMVVMPVMTPPRSVKHARKDINIVGSIMNVSTWNQVICARLIKVIIISGIIRHQNVSSVIRMLIVWPVIICQRTAPPVKRDIHIR